MTLSVRKISLVDLQVRLARAGTPAPSEGGPDDDVIIGQNRASTAYWRYETNTEILIEVGLARGTGVDVAELFEQLEPIDIAAWTEVATPFNVVPMQPR